MKIGMVQCGKFQPCVPLDSLDAFIIKRTAPGAAERANA